MKSSLTVGILAKGDPSDVRTWSGVPHFMVRALEQRFERVVYLPALPPQLSLTQRLSNRMRRCLFGRPPRRWRDRASLERSIAPIYRLLEEERVDVILAVTVDQLVAYLKTDVPIVLHSDTTFALLEDYYEGCTGLSARERRDGHEVTRLALSRCTAATYPSQWAAKSAVDDYGLPLANVHTTPYGASLESAPTRREIEARDTSGPMRLLFVGAAWERKGGPLVTATFEELRSRGIDTELVVVGADPQMSCAGLTSIPFLNKQVPDDLATYRRLWLSSSFLFMPTRQETFGAVYCEAAANGLPSVATLTGGVNSAIDNGVSGLLLPLDAGPVEYADALENAWTRKGSYAQLVEGARTRFEQALNWDAWASQTAAVLQSAALVQA